MSEMLEQAVIDAISEWVGETTSDHLVAAARAAITTVRCSADSADLSELEECGTADAFDDADFAILYREVEDSGTTSLQEITNVSQSFCRLIAGRLRDLNAPQIATPKACPKCQNTGWCHASKICELSGYPLVARSQAVSAQHRYDQDGQTCPTCGRVGNGEG